MSKDCPMCRATNNDSAAKCKNCQYQFTQPAVPPPPPLNYNILPHPYQVVNQNRFSRSLAVILSVIAGIILGASGTWFFINHLPAPQNDPNIIKYVSNTNPTTYVGIIHHAIITSTFQMPDTPPGGTPSAPHDHCTARYIVANNPISQVETFWDRDSPPFKTNTTDVFSTCQRYQENSGDPEQGKPVTLIVTGLRDSSQSVYRNILFILPEDQ